MTQETHLKFEEIIKKYGNLPFTNGLTEVIFQNFQDQPNQAEVFEEICWKVVDYTEQFKELLKTSDLNTVLFSIYHAGEEIRDDAPSPISCRKGCSHCCHINVSISQAEASVIEEFCREQGITIDKQWFKAQRKLTEQDHARSEYSRCAFLKNNECSIYEARPFNCRYYFALTPAFLCNAIEFPKGTVCVYVNMEKEILHSAFINLLHVMGHDTTQDSMARIFLNRKKQIS